MITKNSIYNKQNVRASTADTLRKSIQICRKPADQFALSKKMSAKEIPTSCHEPCQ